VFSHSGFDSKADWLPNRRTHRDNWTGWKEAFWIRSLWICQTLLSVEVVTEDVHIQSSAAM
jgi:hypothetical protein